MKRSAIDRYRERLAEERRELLRRIAEVESELSEIHAEREIEWMDFAQAELPEDVLERLDAQSRQQLESIGEAMRRIDAGTYGRCEGCERPIAAERLDALPTARFCLACQQRAEAQPVRPGR